jgi:hypothetical protein
MTRKSALTDLLSWLVLIVLGGLGQPAVAQAYQRLVRTHRLYHLNVNDY